MSASLYGCMFMYCVRAKLSLCVYNGNRLLGEYLGVGKGSP